MTYLTTTEAAEILGVHPDTISAWARSGALKAKQFGRSWMVYQQAVDAKRKEYDSGAPRRGARTLRERGDAS